MMILGFPVKWLLAIAVTCVIVVAVIAGLNSKSPEPNNTPTRESAIPKDTVKVTPETDIFPPILHSGEWMTPVPLSQSINTAGGEDSAFVLPDGNTLYFFFTPNVTVPVEKQLLDGVTGIYVPRKQNGTWSTAERVVLQDSGKLALNGAAFVLNDTMWFASAREGYTVVNHFTAEFINGKWANWQYTGDKLNKDYQVGEMHITADGNALYFHSGRAGGKGQYDIWVTRRMNGEWQQPENIEAVNSAENDGWPFINQDGSELWFTRTYMSSPAVYRSKNVNGNWSTPELILSQFAAEPTQDNDGTCTSYTTISTAALR
jgi:hypothetical protein